MQLLGRHVVEKHCISANRQQFFQLIESIDFNFDLDHVAEPFAGPSNRLRDAAGNHDVVVLNHDAIIQPEPMIDAAAHTNRVFFEGTQPGRGFPCANDLGPTVANALDGVAGSSRDTGQPTHQIERGALGGEDRPCWSGNGSEHASRWHIRTVLANHFGLCISVKQMEC